MRKQSISKICSVAIAAAVIAIAISGCAGGNNSQEQAAGTPQQETSVSSDSAGQEEVVDDAGKQYMDPAAIEGKYIDIVSQRATMDIVYNENKEYYEVLIHWGSSATEHTQWTMTAYDVGDTKSLVYGDGTCDNVTTKDNGDSTSENVYTEKTGSLTVNEDMTITWIDDENQEHIFERDSSN